MKEDNCCEKEMGKCCHHHHPHHAGGFIYKLGLIGAIVYFIGQATDFGSGVVGLLKALVWPAFLVYDAFKFFVR